MLIQKNYYNAFYSSFFAALANAPGVASVDSVAGALVLKQNFATTASLNAALPAVWFTFSGWSLGGGDQGNAQH